MKQIDETYHYLLLYNQGAFQRLLMLKLAPFGLTIGQPKILDYLADHNGCMQKELGTACQVDPATIVGLINRMEENGLVERRQQDGNRRSFYVYLTVEGWKKTKAVKIAFEELEKDAFHEFSNEEQEQLVSQMLRVKNNLMEMMEV